MTVRKSLETILRQFKGKKLHQDRILELMKQDFRERHISWKADELNSRTVFRTLRKLAELGRQGRSDVMSDGQGNFWVKSTNEETVKLTTFFR